MISKATNFDHEKVDLGKRNDFFSQLEVTAALQAKLGLEGEVGLAGGTIRFVVLKKLLKSSSFSDFTFLAEGTIRFWLLS